jgi:hypothetical protein
MARRNNQRLRYDGLLEWQIKKKKNRSRGKLTDGTDWTDRLFEKLEESKGKTSEDNRNIQSN